MADKILPSYPSISGTYIDESAHIVLATDSVGRGGV